MRLLTLLACLLTFDLWASGQITELYSPTEIIADVFDTGKIKLNKRVLILSRIDNKLIAFGTVKKLDLSVTPSVALIKIEEIVDNSMILTQDFIYPLDYDVLKEKKVPGFVSLTLQGDNDIPAHFKELAYFGVFTSEGHTLDAQEFLVSPFQLQYGVTNDFGIKVVNALWIDSYLNLGFKYRVVRNKYAKISVNTLGAYKLQSQDYIWQVGGVITLPTNSKFQNHLMLNFTLDPQFDDARATKDLGIFKDSDIRSITEYVSNDWNRILYGPTYNVELQTFGGTVSYMWIWNTFHTSLGIATKDFTNLRFGVEGYYYVYDLFWRW